MKVYNIKKAFPESIKNFIKIQMLKLKYKNMRIDNTAKVDIHSIFGEYVSIGKNVDLNKCNVGSCTYFSSDDKFFNTKIGRFCSVGPGVRCGMGIHPSNTFVSTHPVFFSNSKQIDLSFVNENYFTEILPIEIGNDVWIGANVIILDGVKIGNGAILGAGSVVIRDVPDYAIVGGVPAKVIKYRFDKNQIKFLLQDKWWEKDIKYLCKNFKYFHNIENYIRFLNSGGTQ